MRWKYKVQLTFFLTLLIDTSSWLIFILNHKPKYSKIANCCRNGVVLNTFESGWQRVKCQRAIEGLHLHIWRGWKEYIFIRVFFVCLPSSFNSLSHALYLFMCISFCVYFSIYNFFCSFLWAHVKCDKKHGLHTAYENE